MNNFPSRVTVEMTNSCNLSCKMCPRRFMKSPVGFMSIDLWKDIIDEISLYDVIFVPFWRGESTTHPYFDRMIDYVLEKVKQIQLATNGLRIAHHLPTLLQMDFVSISLHIFNVIPAIKMLDKARKESDTPEKPEIQVSVVKGETTESELDKVRPYVDIIRTYDEHSKDGKFGSIGGRNNRRFCSKLVNDITIAYNGDISRCCHNWRTDAPINIRNHSIKEVWNGEAYDRIRKNYPDDVCIVCDQWDSRTVGEIENTTKAII